MILLSLVSWPYFRKHVLRSILTVAGIVLGVAVFVGMRTANQSVMSAFSTTVDRIAGKSELQVTAGEVGFPEDVLDRVRSASTVHVAAPVIEAVADTRLQGQGSLLILGVDMTGDRSLRDYDLASGDETIIDDPLVFLAQPDSLIVSTELAEKNQLQVGSTLGLETAEGEKPFVVRGIMKSSGLTSAFGGSLGIMDIYAAQKMFGRGQTFDRIDIGVTPGRTIAECEAELRATLGPGFQIDPPSARGQQFESMIASYSTMVSISSLLALVIGMFIIYNSFAIAVTQRRREIGILRALGATRRQIRGLFLAESAVTGLIGSIGGVLVGMAIARGIGASIGLLLSDVYGVAQRPDDSLVNGVVLGAALGIGVATSMLAAAIPAMDAARVDPVQALQKGKNQVLSPGESRARAISAVALAAVSLTCLFGGGSRVVFYSGYLLAVVAALLLCPLLSLGLTRAMRPLLTWLRPVEGALAADSLIQTPRRTSASVAALMLSLALVVAFAGMARASYDSIVEWANTALNPDLFVVPSPSVVVRTIRFPSAMFDELAAIPGVQRVQTVREARIAFREASPMVVAVDMRSIGQTVRRRIVAGDEEDMYRLSAEGRGIVVSDNLAELQHLHLGEVLDVPAPRGVIRLPIVGIVVDYSDQQGAIIVDRQVFTQYWNDDSVNLFRVYLDPGARLSDVRKQILERYAGQRQVFVLTNEELRSYILSLANQWFGLTWIQIALAVLVAMFGIVNTLTVSITDRRRELGILRAVGGARGQVRRTIWLEALSIGLLGLMLGYALGALNLYYVLQVVQHDISGMRLQYQFPVGIALALTPAILGAALLAAIWPAESAVRGSLTEALEYE